MSKSKFGRYFIEPFPAEYDENSLFGVFEPQGDLKTKSGVDDLKTKEEYVNDISITMLTDPHTEKQDSLSFWNRINILMSSPNYFSQSLNEISPLILSIYSFLCHFLLLTLLIIGVFTTIRILLPCHEFYFGFGIRTYRLAFIEIRVYRLFNYQSTSIRIFDFQLYG